MPMPLSACNSTWKPIPCPRRTWKCNAFVAPITVNYSDNGTSSVLTGTAGYFNYVDDGYTGVDLRIGPWGTDRMMQIIFVSPGSLFTGPTTNPTVSVIETDGNACGFYPNGSSTTVCLRQSKATIRRAFPNPPRPSCSASVPWGCWSTLGGGVGRRLDDLRYVRDQDSKTVAGLTARRWLAERPCRHD